MQMFRKLKRMNPYIQSTEADARHDRHPLATTGISSNVDRSSSSNDRNSDAFFSKLFSSSSQPKDLNVPGHYTHEENDKNQTRAILDSENNFDSLSNSMVMAPPLPTHSDLIDSLFG